MLYLLIASNNAHKREEIEAIISANTQVFDAITLVTPNQLDISIEPEETGSTFLENGVIKAHAFFSAFLQASKTAHTVMPNSPPHPSHRYAVLADDSGLCVDSLGGGPGIHSARYALNDESYDKNDPHFQCKKLLTEIPHASVRSAHFVCCAVLVWTKHFLTPKTISDTSALESISHVATYQATWQGEIATDIYGTEGFGYDPIFYIPEQKCTSAQLSPQEKNALSHRTQAIRGLMPVLRAFSTK